MKISVIIPAYNAEKTLCKCLDSIIKQSYKNLEIIIINDGSTDNTLPICNNYSKEDSRIIVLNNKNHGVSYSRNCGVKIASGDYITFVDADDYLDNNCFEKIINKLTSDIDVFRYNFKVVGGKSFTNNIYELKDKKIVINSTTINKLYKHFLTFEEPIPNLVMLLIIRKDIAKKISFNEKLYMMEDANYYIDMFSKINNIYFSDMKSYNYYVNENSVTHNKKNYKKNILGLLDTNKAIMDKISNNISNDLICKINCNHSRIISQMLINQYRYSRKEFRKVFMELQNNDKFIDIVKNNQSGPLKNRFILFIISKKMYILMNISLEILKVTYLISRKWRCIDEKN